MSVHFKSANTFFTVNIHTCCGSIPYICNLNTHKATKIDSLLKPYSFIMLQSYSNSDILNKYDFMTQIMNTIMNDVLYSD